MPFLAKIVTRYLPKSFKIFITRMGSTERTDAGIDTIMYQLSSYPYLLQLHDFNVRLYNK